MKIDRLFHAIVLGSGLAVTGCHPAAVRPTQPNTPVEPEATETSAPASNPGGLDCKSLCNYETSEVLCPDSNLDEAMNCCWLMAQRHPCCDARPGESIDTPK